MRGTALSNSASHDVPSWQVRGLDRSLDQARNRTVARMHRFVGAARDLANETGNASFTVADVARRAGLSLKLFYQCFAGKDDLLLALLEEDSRLGASMLAETLAAPLDGAGNDAPTTSARLRAYIDGIFGLAITDGALGYAGVLVREHRRLSEARPDELAEALAPLINLLAEQICPGEPNAAMTQRAANAMFTLILTGIHEVTLGRGDAGDLASWIAEFGYGGIAGLIASTLSPSTLSAHHPGGHA
jgi:AcrR family transcriptional regulator